jgi:hypothetical protein
LNKIFATGSAIDICDNEVFMHERSARGSGNLTRHHATHPESLEGFLTLCACDSTFERLSNCWQHKLQQMQMWRLRHEHLEQRRKKARIGPLCRTQRLHAIDFRVANNELVRQSALQFHALESREAVPLLPMPFAVFAFRIVRRPRRNLSRWRALWKHSNCRTITNFSVPFSSSHIPENRLEESAHFPTFRRQRSTNCAACERSRKTPIPPSVLEMQSRRRLAIAALKSGRLSLTHSPRCNSDYAHGHPFASGAARQEHPFSGQRYQLRSVQNTALPLFKCLNHTAWCTLNENIS